MRRLMRAPWLRLGALVASVAVVACLPAATAGAAGGPSAPEDGCDERWLFRDRGTPSALPPPSFAVARYVSPGAAFEHRVYVPEATTGATRFHFPADAYIDGAALTYDGDDEWSLTVDGRDSTTGFSDGGAATMVVFPFIAPDEGTTSPREFSPAARVFYGSGWVEAESHSRAYRDVLGRSTNLASGVWFGGKGAYPGGTQAPIVVFQEREEAVILGAVNDPPQFVDIRHSGGKTGFVYYPTSLASPGGVSIRALVHRTRSTCAAHQPWQVAAQRYKRWLDEHFPTPRYPAWMARGEGQYQIGLNDFPCAEAPCPTTAGTNFEDARTVVERTWRDWKDYFGSVVFWGQMSNYSGPASLAWPPRAPDEPSGCCLPLSTIHPRYQPWLPDFVRRAGASGYHAGYYVRPHLDLARPQLDGWADRRPTWSQSAADWFVRNSARYGASASYFDEIGNTPLLPVHTSDVNGDGTWTAKGDADGAQDTAVADPAETTYDGTLPSQYGVGGVDPKKVLDFIAGHVPRDAIVENWVDVYPRAGLVTGQLLGTEDFPGGPGVNPFICDACATPVLLRFLVGDRLVYAGEAGGGGDYWGLYQYRGGQRNPSPFWMERQVFLLGAKSSVTHPDIDLDQTVNGTSPDGKDPYLLHIKELRDATSWWRRAPRYVDTVGLGGIPAGLDARRFVAGNDDLVVIDNPERRAGLTVSVRGRSYPVPTAVLSVLDINRQSGKVVVHMPSGGGR